MKRRSEPAGKAEERDTSEEQQRRELAERLEADLWASRHLPLMVQTDYLIERGWSILDNWTPQRRGRVSRLKQRMVTEISSWEPGSVVEVYLIEGVGAAQLEAWTRIEHHTLLWTLSLLVDTSPRLRWIHVGLPHYEVRTLAELCTGSCRGFPAAGYCNVALLLYLTTRCPRCK